MPVITPNEQKVVRQLQSDVQSEIKELDTSTEKSNFISGLVVALAKSLHHFYLALADFANRQVHPQTATGTKLFNGWWSVLTGITRSPVSRASGYLIATGDAGAIIPLGSNFTSGSNNYESTSSVTITTQIVRANSLIFTNGVAIFESVSDHGLASGVRVNISGAEDSAFNGEYVIFTTSGNEFTYEPDTPPVGSAGFDVIGTSSFARIPVTSETAGVVGNLDTGTVLFESAIDNVDSEALIPFDGVTGGAELEDTEDFRDRLLDALASTLGAFTSDELGDVVKNIPGVTRVFIRKAKINPGTGWPNEGQVVILFMRDNDANPFPSNQEVQKVHDEIVSKIMTANTAQEDVIVVSPVPQKIDFSFSSITPDNASMRLAISEKLKQYFNENISIGADEPAHPHTDLNLLDLQCVIKDVVSLETGQRLIDFTLTTPSENITRGPYDYPVLGTVSFVS